MAVRYSAGCWGRTGAELGHAWPRFPSHGWVAAAYRCWANPHGGVLQPRSPPGSQKDAGSSAGAEPVGQHRGRFGAAQGLRGWEFLSAIYWSFSLHGEGAAGALTRVWRGVKDFKPRRRTRNFGTALLPRRTSPCSRVFMAAMFFSFLGWKSSRC